MKKRVLITIVMTLIMVMFVPKFVSAMEKIDILYYSYSEEYIEKLETAYKNPPEGDNITISDVIMWVDSCAWNGEEGVKKIMSMDSSLMESYRNIFDKRTIPYKYDFGFDYKSDGIMKVTYDRVFKIFESNGTSMLALFNSLVKNKINNIINGRYPSNFDYAEEYVKKLKTEYNNSISKNASLSSIIMWIDSCIYNGDEGLKKLVSLPVSRYEKFLETVSSQIACTSKYMFGYSSSSATTTVIEEVSGNYTRLLVKLKNNSDSDETVKLNEIKSYVDTIRKNKINRIVKDIKANPNYNSSGITFAEVPDSGDDVINNLTNLTDSIWATIITIVQAVAVGCVIFAGLRYMYASADKKADIKKGMVYLAIGAIFVFATSSVMRFIFSIGNSLL